MQYRQARIGMRKLHHAGGPSLDHRTHGTQAAELVRRAAPKANAPKKAIEGLTIHAVDRIEEAIEVVRGV